MLHTVPADVNWQLAQDCEQYHHTGRKNIPLKSVICVKSIFEDLMSVVVQRRISSVSWWPFFKQKTTLIVSSQKISPLRISYNLFDCSHPFPQLLYDPSSFSIQQALGAFIFSLNPWSPICAVHTLLNVWFSTEAYSTYPYKKLTLPLPVSTSCQCLLI